MDKIKIINESIDYIIKHLDENISVKDVAGYFHFSKYYFSRVFKEITGESIYAFMKRLKMDQSAVDIKVGKNKIITDVGLDYGYSSSNYSSAFKAHHHISPVTFKKSLGVSSINNPFHPKVLEKFNVFDDYDKNITIQNMDKAFIIYERFIGSYIDLKEKWYNFIDANEAIIGPDTLLIERFYNDPMVTGINQCLCDLCITVENPKNKKNTAILDGGTFAVYQYEGKIKDIFAMLQGLFCVWLPNSNYEMVQRYGLNIYRQINRYNESIVMDICIPIK